MRHLVVNRKYLILILAIGLLAFWMHGSARSQTDEASSSNTSSLKSAADIWTETLPSVVYIIAGEYTGSGVLVQLEPNVVLTNEHVTKKLDNVTVYFPAYHLKGQLIREREFYRDKRNHDLLKVLGYATNGRVIATDTESDVAVIILEGVPATAKPIKSDDHYDYSHMERGEPVHILGNPGNRDFLWQWDPGFFQQHDGERLTLEASVYYGNSGGPVVDQSGTLIGLAVRIDHETKTYVVPLEPIIDLVDKVKALHIFSIANNTDYTVDYEIKWSDSSDWEEFSLEPESEPKIHEKEVKSFPSNPTIRYRDAPESQDYKTPKDSTETPEDKVPSEDTTTATEHVLYTNFRYFGSNFKERINIDDSFPYRFDYDSEEKKIKLRLRRETAYIHNKTDNEMKYSVQATRRQRPQNYTLKPYQWNIHWFDKPPTEEILYNYPRIRFNNMKPRDDVIDESTDDTRHVRIYTDRKLRTATEFLNFDFKGLRVDFISYLLNTEDNYYHFGPHRELPDLIDLHSAVPTPAVSRSKALNILGRSIT